MDWDLVLAPVPVVVAALVLWRGWRRIPEGQLAWWEERFDAVVATEHEPYVRDRLERGRRIRSTAAAVGVVGGGLPAYLNVVAPEQASRFANPVVANAWIGLAIAGALLAELVVVQHPVRRVASLTARRAADYVDPRWFRWLAGGVAVSALGAVVAVATHGFRWWYALVGLAACALAAAAVPFGLHRITSRPALDADGPLRGIDEALRSDGAHHLVGAAIALCATGTSVTLSALPPVLAPLSLVGSLAGTAGLFLWMTIARESRWSVARARVAHAGTR
jgi:hypothetical protein